MSILHLQVDGSVGLQAAIEKLEAAIEDMPQTLDQAAAVLFNRVRTRYLSEQDTFGNPWPVSKAALLRAKIGRGGGTLFDTGRLFHSLQLYAVGPNSRAIGTDVPYGKYHMTGTRFMPKREFLGFNDQDVSIAEAFVIKRIEEALA